MNHIEEIIVDRFQNFRMPPTPIDQFEQIGKEVLKQKMQPFIASNKPINFVMLGFPMKSPNSRDKVIGHLPDLGEQVAMQNFADFANKIKEVYSPGINISIVSDGYVFSDIMDVSDSIVEQYEEQTIDMARVAPVSWFNMKDFYSKNQSLDSIREKIMSHHGISSQELEKRILMDSDVNFLYRGMIKFLTLDLAIKDFASNTQLQKEAKKVAREMMFRNEAYSKLIQNEFKDHIRLSMHPSMNNGTKFSFQLIPSKRAWTSPWHCAILVENGEYVTIHKKDAIAAGYELQFKDNRAFNFIN